MIRLFIFAVVAFLGLVVTILSLVLMFTIIRWIKRFFSGGQKFVNNQHEDWKKKQAKQKAEASIPDFLKQASQRLDNIDQSAKQLTEKWQLLLNPVILDSHEMLQRGIAKPEQAHFSRNFFTVTLKALEGFTEALVDMNEGMQDQEEEKARQNIAVFMNDIYKYRAKFEARKRFDFHVMMEVIKQRLGK
ncbi:MAG: hypothetical protein V3U84_09730 [Thiotrichaceae bacterium]